MATVVPLALRVVPAAQVRRVQAAQRVRAVRRAQPVQAVPSIPTRATAAEPPLARLASGVHDPLAEIEPNVAGSEGRVRMVLGASGPCPPLPVPS